MPGKRPDCQEKPSFFPSSRSQRGSRWSSLRSPSSLPPWRAARTRRFRSRRRNGPAGSRRLVRSPDFRRIGSTARSSGAACGRKCAGSGCPARGSSPRPPSGDAGWVTTLPACWASTCSSRYSFGVSVSRTPLSVHRAGGEIDGQRADGDGLVRPKRRATGVTASRARAPAARRCRTA